MALTLADRRDQQFVLNEQLKIGELCEAELYCDLNTKTFDLLLNEARNLAVKELLATFKESDQIGAVLENGAVKVPPSFHRAYKLFCEGEWLTVSDDTEVGGQGMPCVLGAATLELFAGANLAFSIYAMLGHGAGKLYEIFGTPEQKKLFLPNVYSGKWGGTMCLTEPSAGSDVGALTTTAVKNADGTYSISGTKIFISAGDHDMVENIIHPVLARIEGDAPGTGGISIFIVPKIWVNEDGSLGGHNDVECVRIEEKMGIHGSATCVLSFGAKGKCRGFLLGQERQGMKIMFHMMNEERLNVGVQGLAGASAAYANAVNYARERLQSRNILQSRDPAAPQVPIIEHPDVRRMLLQMKAYVDGLRSLNYYVGLCMDRARISRSDEDKVKYQGLVDLMTPICKAYSTDKGCFVAQEAIQIYGGYGYTQEYPVEQIYRDTKITTIYEGTNGIQAMDLLGRKLGMKNGQVFVDFLGQINQTVMEAKKIESLAEMAAKVEEAANKLGRTAMVLGKAARSEKVLAAFANAYGFMESMGDVILGWMHLWRAVVALPALEKAAKGRDIAQAVASSKDAAFYDGQIKTARFFINTLLPLALGRMDAVMALEGAAVDIADSSFGS
jgi:hypothetical protein